MNDCKYILKAGTKTAIKRDLVMDIGTLLDMVFITLQSKQKIVLKTILVFNKGKCNYLSKGKKLQI